MIKIYEKLVKKWKVLFCYLLIFMSILLFLIVFVKKPTRINTTFVYNSGKERELQEAVFPIEQKINVNVDNLRAVWLFYGDDSINQYNYNILITNQEGKEVFNYDFRDYASNIAELGVEGKNINKGDELTLRISCEECENVKLNYGIPLDDRDIVAGTGNKSLIVSMDNRVTNNSYYWYCMVGVVIAFLLLPFARSEENE